jgi:pimeloyl-ACP methyl ester carboxylesterase
MRLGTSLVLALAASTTSCNIFASHLGVEKVGYQAVYADLTENAVGSDRLSIATRETLHLFDLEDDWEQDKADTLERLHRFVHDIRSASLLYALSELSYTIAEETEDRRYFLLAATYAYFCLLGDGTEPPSPFDRRFRVACDLYNRGLARALQPPEDEPLDVQESTHVDLPIGSIDLRLLRGEFPWPEGTFELYQPADQYAVKGLSWRVRSPGLGVPLIALRGDEETPLAEFIPPSVKLPASAFLRLEGDVRDLESGLSGILEVHPAYSSVVVDDYVIPLETDITTPLAFMLAESNEVTQGIARFFGKEEEYPPGVFMLEPYQENKIPVVFVHGTASSPATWAEMFNLLSADAYLRDRFQFWFFTYGSGNPVAYSAWKLRDSLAHIIAELDPEGDDEQLQNMVLVGHSQGGMLVRMMVTDGSRRFTERLSVSIDELDLDEESRALVENCLIFAPSPYVQRVVFMSTPHRGSFVAGGWIGNFFKKRVNQARDLKKTMTQVFHSDALPRELTKNMPTSIDNMTADNGFVQNLASAPIEGVPYHSIIAVHTDGPIEEGNDGVVAYESARLEGANSELVVESGHSSQQKPRAILEVRRILYEHLGERPRSGIRPTFDDLRVDAEE